MSGLSLSLGLSQPSGTGLPAAPQLTLTPMADGTIEANMGNGTVTLTVTSPVSYAGSYTISPADLASGPVLLRAPEIAGPSQVGQTLSISQGGLWAYNGSAPVVTRRWQSDALGDGIFTDIPGATAPGFQLTANETGDRVRLAESAQGSAGTRTGFSLPRAVSAAFTVSHLGVGSANPGTGAVHTITGLNLGAADPAREIYAIVTSVYGSIDAALNITGVTIGGVAATQVAERAHLNGPIEIWKATVPTGTTGSVVITHNLSILATGVALYRVIGGTVVGGAVSASASGSTGPLNLNLNTVSGQVVIAAARSLNGGLNTMAGVVKNHDTDIRSNEFFASGHEIVATGQAPRTVSAVSATSAEQYVGIAISLGAS